MIQEKDDEDEEEEEEETEEMKELRHQEMIEEAKVTGESRIMIIWMGGGWDYSNILNTISTVQFTMGQLSNC